MRIENASPRAGAPPSSVASPPTSPRAGAPPSSPTKDLDKKILRYAALPEVDAELAALVCRQVILPLFDTTGEELDITKGIQRPTGILAEVRLSERLLQQVIATRDEVRAETRRLTCLARETGWLQKRCGHAEKQRQQQVGEMKAFFEQSRKVYQDVRFGSEAKHARLKTYLQSHEAEIAAIREENAALKNEKLAHLQQLQKGFEAKWREFRGGDGRHGEEDPPLPEAMDENRHDVDMGDSFLLPERRQEQGSAGDAGSAATRATAKKVKSKTSSENKCTASAGACSASSSTTTTASSSSSPADVSSILLVLNSEREKLSQERQSLLDANQMKCKFEARKELQDSLHYQQLTQRLRRLELNRYREDLDWNSERLQRETEFLSKIEGELEAKKKVLERDCVKLSQELDDAQHKHQSEMGKLGDDRERLMKERDRLAKKLKEMSMEYEKMRQKWKKYYRTRRANLLFEQDTKTCKNCGKEYMENQNFNWSCRTHSSEFGGELWWCCGKSGITALGCKFSKHESKDDLDLLDLDANVRSAGGADADDVDENGAKRTGGGKAKDAKVRCYSCKEVGHKAKNCPRDPNILASKDPVKELKRLEVRSGVKSEKKKAYQVPSRIFLDKLNEQMKFECTPLAEADAFFIQPCAAAGFSFSGAGSSGRKLLGGGARTAGRSNRRKSESQSPATSSSSSSLTASGSLGLVFGGLLSGVDRRAGEGGTGSASFGTGSTGIGTMAAEAGAGETRPGDHLGTSITNSGRPSGGGCPAVLGQGHLLLNSRRIVDALDENSTALDNPFQDVTKNIRKKLRQRIREAGAATSGDEESPGTAAAAIVISPTTSGAERGPRPQTPADSAFTSEKELTEEFLVSTSESEEEGSDSDDDGADDDDHGKREEI
eukprot:g4010.t1